jgi:DNA modification methylase
VIRLLSGDCRDLLATLPADSVQCVVTSPPYYGLRDYGTAQWDGGDAACDHVKVVYKPAVYANSRGEVGNGCSGWRGEQRNQSEPYRDTCGKCGAMRVDRQIGLEATPDEYLATMVGVFRHIRRVLRPDGTCWVNMGDSYATQPAGNFGGAKRGVGPFDEHDEACQAQGPADDAGAAGAGVAGGRVVGAVGHHLAQAEPDAGELRGPADECA